MLNHLKQMIKKRFYSFFPNYYKSNHNRSALVSYLTAPLYRKETFTHQNVIELLKCCEAIRDLGFNVDIVDYMYDGKIDYSRYSLLFGFGYPYGKSFHDPKCKAVRVAYCTGAMNLFDQMKRLKYLHERRGVKLLPRREYFYPFFQETIAMSDAILVTGNEWSRRTVESYNAHSYSIQIPVYLDTIPQIDIAKKDFTAARKHFLWFGSSGAVHKGLDLLLDAFAQMPDLHLHVGGPIVHEKDFIHEYEHELYRLPNIHLHGFVSIASEQFRSLLETAAFIIFPSCSEGGSGSAVTCMAGGLIPIVTESAAINIQDFGFLIKDERIDEIQRVVQSTLNYDERSLKELSQKARRYTHQNHSSEMFYQQIKEVVSEIMGVVSILR